MTKARPQYESTTYPWDYKDRLTSVAVPGTGGTITFKYDPFGRRIQKVAPAGTTNYLYDGANVIEEVDGTGTALARYSQGSGVDQPLSDVVGGVAKFYDADGLGSITSLADISSSLTDTYTTDSFGKTTASTGTTRNPYRYTARDLDSETGLYYYRARYYDPSSGRFLSEDPLRFGGGSPNFFSYVTNNPVNKFDPSGLVVIGGNFPPGGASDVILALQQIRDAIKGHPGCDCYFRAHGGRSLSELLDDPHIFIQYYPKHIYPFGPNGKPALGANFSSSQDIYITPDGLGLGQPDLAGTITHELLHRNRGGGGSEAEAEAAIQKCGILPSFLSLPSINVTVTPK